MHDFYLVWWVLEGVDGWGKEGVWELSRAKGPWPSHSPSPVFREWVVMLQVQHANYDRSCQKTINDTPSKPINYVTQATVSAYDQS